MIAEWLCRRVHRRKRQPSYALGAEIGPAIGVDRLPVDVACARAAEKPHHGRNVVRPAARSRDGLVGQMVRRFRFVLGPWRADQARDDAVHGNAVIGEVVGQRPGEADDPGLRGDHMRAVLRTGMRTEPADIDDAPRAGLAQSRKARLHAMKRAIQRDIKDFAPLAIIHLGECLFAPQSCVIHEAVDATELLYSRIRHRLH